MNLAPCPLCSRPARLELSPKGDWRVACADAWCVKSPWRIKQSIALSDWTVITSARFKTTTAAPVPAC